MTCWFFWDRWLNDREVHQANRILKTGAASELQRFYVDFTQSRDDCYENVAFTVVHKLVSSLNKTSFIEIGVRANWWRIHWQITLRCKLFVVIKACTRWIGIIVLADHSFFYFNHRQNAYLTIMNLYIIFHSLWERTKCFKMMKR